MVAIGQCPDSETGAVPITLPDSTPAAMSVRAKRLLRARKKSMSLAVFTYEYVGVASCSRA